MENVANDNWGNSIIFYIELAAAFTYFSYVKLLTKTKNVISIADHLSFLFIGDSCLQAEGPSATVCENSGKLILRQIY